MTISLFSAAVTDGSVGVAAASMANIPNIGTPMLYGVFFALVIALLLIDFFTFKPPADGNIPVKQAAIWSAVWVGVSIAFGAALWWHLKDVHTVALANQKVAEFFTGYLIEKSLAVDNVFVWLMIFTAFAIPPALQRRVLLYGVLGAIIMRTIMIFMGAWLISQFSWILFIFGAFLVWTGIHMWRNHDEPKDPKASWLYQQMQKRFRITDDLYGEKFAVVKNGVRYLTPLAIVLVLVEISDLVFAVDSIPAIFAVTTDPYIVLTANLLAILGLRAMFFLLSGVADRFHLLPYGLAIILVFIGIKMLLLEWFHMPIAISLGVVASVLTITMVLSWKFPNLGKPSAPSQ